MSKLFDKTINSMAKKAGVKDSWPFTDNLDELKDELVRQWSLYFNKEPHRIRPIEDKIREVGGDDSDLTWARSEGQKRASRKTEGNIQPEDVEHLKGLIEKGLQTNEKEEFEYFLNELNTTGDIKDMERLVNMLDFQRILKM
jgi:hypothetical protein